MPAIAVAPNQLQFVEESKPLDPPQYRKGSDNNMTISQKKARQIGR